MPGQQDGDETRGRDAQMPCGAVRGEGRQARRRQSDKQELEDSCLHSEIKGASATLSIAKGEL